jgi:hypothetical protein
MLVFSRKVFMKAMTCKLFFAAAGSLGLLATPLNLPAEDSATNTQTVATSDVAPAPTPAPAPQLSYGVPQIVKLAQAQISDSTIIAYIKSSGNSYGLDANQIIYLRQQGISDGVINAMLTQPKPGSVASAAAPGPAPVATAPDAAQAAQPAPADAPQPEDQTVYAPATSVYVMPDTSPYPYYYPAYYGYPYYGPVGVTIGIGGRWGGGWGGYHGVYRGGSRGGYRGGGHR